MKSKNTILFLLPFLLFFGCEKITKLIYQLELHTKIDTLLAKSNNYSLSKNKRLVFADSVSFYLKEVESDSLKKHYTFKLANRYYNLRFI